MCICSREIYGALHRTQQNVRVHKRERLFCRGGLNIYIYIKEEAEALLLFYGPHYDLFGPQQQYTTQIWLGGSRMRILWLSPVFFSLSGTFADWKGCTTTHSARVSIARLFAGAAGRCAVANMRDWLWFITLEALLEVYIPPRPIHIIRQSSLGWKGGSE